MTTRKAAAGSQFAPAIYTPAYYQRIAELERDHWWHVGMRRIAAAMVRLASPGPFPRILDAGCGTGGALEWAQASFGPSAISGVDISADAIAHTRRKNPAWRLSEASILALPFEDDSFDLVICWDVLQHLDTDGSDARALTEIMRVLAPGGIAVLRTNARAGMGEAGRAKDADFQKYSLNEVEALIRSAGATIVKASYVNFVGALYSVIKERLRRALRPIEHEPGHKAYQGLRLKEARPALNGVFLGLLGLEARYLGRGARTIGFGHSIIAVLRKDGPGRPS